MEWGRRDEKQALRHGGFLIFMCGYRLLANSCINSLKSYGTSCSIARLWDNKQNEYLFETKQWTLR